MVDAILIILPILLIGLLVSMLFSDLTLLGVAYLILKVAF